MAETHFEWDKQKEEANIRKHHASFELAQEAFLDPQRVIAEDSKHSQAEPRYYCIGRAGGGILTVRFTYRIGVIRIIGAGFWREGKKVYAKKNSL